MGLLQRFRDAAICVVLLGIPFFFLDAHLEDPSAVGFLDRILLTVGAPIQFVSSQAARGVSSLVEDYVFLGDVAEERDRLEEEVARLREEGFELRVQAEENRRLRALLGVRERTSGEVIGALVIGREFSNFFRVIRIRVDRGDRDRVKAGMPVISSEGLVGQIQRAWDRYADVLLVSDPKSKVDVVFHRSGARGMLQGTGQRGRYGCEVQYLSAQDEVRVGDELLTSGLGQRFPRGILVGHVSAVLRAELGLNQEVEVSPAVDFTRLDTVLILREASPTEELDNEAPR